MRAKIHAGPGLGAWHFVLLAVFVATFVWSLIHPARLPEWIGEALPTFVGITTLVFTFHRFRFTKLTYTFIVLGTVLMLIGGHYTYSKVPLFNTIKDVFYLSRNDYDRFGHVFQGVIPFLILRELLVCRGVMSLTRKGWLNGIAIAFTLALSAAYELAEFAGAKITGGPAERFLEPQGDMWDTQWDMTSALLGAVLAFMLLSRYQDTLLAKALSVSSDAPGNKKSRKR